MEINNNIMNLAKAKELYNVNNCIPEEVVKAVVQDTCETLSEQMKNEIKGEHITIFIRDLCFDTVERLIKAYVGDNAELTLTSSSFKKITKDIANIFRKNGLSVNIIYEGPYAQFQINGWA